MTRYLDNEICVFEPLFDIYLNNKINILSTCFFKMDKHYKNFNIYVNGLKKLINLINSQDKYHLRIFIDQHIKDDKNIFKLLSSSTKIQIILFKCSDYINNNYHIDVFGAIVRLFPIFNFKNNDADDVIIIDVDLNDEDLLHLKYLMEYNTKSKEIVGKGTIDKLLIFKNLPHYYCGLCGFYNIKFDHKIIIDFIKNAYNIKDKGLYNKRINDFCYGTDELFLNKYLIYGNNFKNIKNIKIGMILNYDINWFLYHYKSDLIKESSKLTLKYLKYILGDIYNPKMSIENMFDIIDKHVYQIDNTNKFKIYISKNFYLLVKYLYKNNLEWFDKNTINLIYENLFNAIDSLSIMFFDPDTVEINKIKNINITTLNVAKK